MSRQEGTVAYIRVYSDTAGDSHFEEVEVDFKPIDVAPPAPPVLEPVGRGRERGYKFRGALTVDRLIAGDTLAKPEINNTSDGGGPNGIRTRVFRPPRAFVMGARSSALLTKRPRPGD